LVQFSRSTLAKHEFSPFNKILLSLFDISNTFMIVFEFAYTVLHISTSMLVEKLV